MRLFFKALRLVIGPIMLFINKLTMPKGVARPVEEQQEFDNRTKDMVLYQFLMCPFCIKVRREKSRLSLNIETRDAKNNQQYRQQLLQGGGEIKVPCLKTSDEQGNTVWMYESNEIIQYLQKKFT